MKRRSRSRSRSRSRRQIKKKFTVMKYKEEKGNDYKKYVGWLASEKKDGWQVLVDQKTVKSKTQKRTFFPPFQHDTRFPIAAELVVDRMPAPTVASLLDPKSKRWSRANLFVFDALIPGDFKTRTKKLKEEIKRLCKHEKSCKFHYLKQTKMKNEKQIKQMIYRIKAKGGEGIVLSNPLGKYKQGKTNVRVKIKPKHDAEGKICGRKLKANGDLKSIRIKSYGRHKFSAFDLGVGFSNYQRRNHIRLLKNNDVIKFKYRNISINSRPKEAVFLHVRKDV